MNSVGRINHEFIVVNYGIEVGIQVGVPCPQGPKKLGFKTPLSGPYYWTQY